MLRDDMLMVGQLRLSEGEETSKGPLHATIEVHTSAGEKTKGAVLSFAKQAISRVFSNAPGLNFETIVTVQSPQNEAHVKISNEGLDLFRLAHGYSKADVKNVELSLARMAEIEYILILNRLDKNMDNPFVKSKQTVSFLGTGHSVVYKQ